MTSKLQLLRYVRPHWRGLGVVLLALLLKVGLDLLRPWPMKLVVDQVLGGQPVPGSVQGVVGALGGSLRIPGPAGPRSDL